MVEDQAVQREMQQTDFLGAAGQAGLDVEGDVGVEALLECAREDLVQTRAASR